MTEKIRTPWMVYAKGVSDWALSPAAQVVAVIGVAHCLAGCLTHLALHPIHLGWVLYLSHCFLQRTLDVLGYCPL